MASHWVFVLFQQEVCSSFGLLCVGWWGQNLYTVSTAINLIQLLFIFCYYDQRLYVIDETDWVVLGPEHLISDDWDSESLAEQRKIWENNNPWISRSSQPFKRLSPLAKKKFFFLNHGWGLISLTVVFTAHVIPCMSLFHHIFYSCYLGTYICLIQVMIFKYWENQIINMDLLR